MSRSRTSHIVDFTFALPLVLVASCTYGPSRIEPPSISPSGSADQALEMYDANDDGYLAGEELDKVPGLKAAIETLDTDKDGKVSERDIAARIETWQSTRLGLLPLTLTVTINGRPLQDATVTFEPEAFLGNEIKPASSKTDEFGGGAPTVPKELRPDPERTPAGVALGFYRVKISKVVNGKETIPRKYNEETFLGQEVAPDVPELASLRLTYSLSTN